MERKDIHGIINKFIMFSLNFDSSLGWIHEAFDPIGLGNHLEDKFRRIQESCDPAGVMAIFWTELDCRCQEVLADWIMDNYGG